jgi:hypothetical protein
LHLGALEAADLEQRLAKVETLIMKPRMMAIMASRLLEVQSDKPFGLLDG